MKKYLLIALMALSTAVFGQVNGRIITHHTNVKTMVWSDSENKIMFFEKTPRYREDNLVEITLKDDNSGRVIITNIQSNDIYEFMIYESSMPDIEEAQMLKLECIEINTSTKCTILFHKIDNLHMISVFMPDDQMAVYMDTYPE